MILKTKVTIQMIKRVLGLLICSMVFPMILQAKPLLVYVESDEVGQALLFNRLGVCYAVSPTHVVHEGYYAALVGGASSAPQGEADEGVTFGYDLTLMRVKGGIEKYCNESYKAAGRLDDTILNETIGHILTAGGLGGMTRQQVSIVSTDLFYLYVSPIDKNQPFMKGMSGSLLEISGKPAGMLMSVHGETGNGKVLRYDRLMETIAPFFGSSSDVDTPILTPNTVDKGTKQITQNLAKKVLSWSTPSLDADSRAENLLDNDPKSVWYGKAGKFPIDIEVLLSKEKTVVLNEVELVLNALKLATRAPKDIEIMISGQKENRWMPVASSTIFKSDTSKVLSFAPVRAKKIKIRIYSNWGDPLAVGLNSIIAR